MNGRPVVVVTGASAGVGRAVARAYGERGASVALLARGTKGLAGAAADVREAGGRALELPTDVADHEQVYAAAERTEAEFGPIDIWVNVAFSSVFARAVDVTAEEFKRTTEVTYLGFVYGTKAALDRMLPREPGHDRAGRLGAGVPRHPAAERVLRGEARDPGVHRVRARRSCCTTGATCTSRWCSCRR